MGLLYGAAFWGVVWYPTRVLDGMGMQGAWLTLVGYGAAFLAFLPFARLNGGDLRHQPYDALALVLAAGWTNVAFVLAVLEGEVVRVVLLFYLSPVWTMLLGHWLLDERLGWRAAVMLGLGMSGALIMLWDPAVGHVPLNSADLLAVTSGLAFAFNNVFTRRITTLGIRAKTELAWFGVVLVSVVTIGMLGGSLPAVSGVAWLGAVALGVLGFLFSTLAVTYGVSAMPVQRSAVIMLFELIVGAATAWWWAGEAIDWREWVGGALILSAALIAIFQHEESV